MHSQDLIMFAHRYQTEQDNIQSVKFCLDVYLNYNEHGATPTEHMDADKSKEQLIEALCRLVGYPRP